MSESATVLRETQIMRDILVAVSALPETIAWRANSFVGITASRQVVRANVPGCPDIIGVRRGRGFGIEVKTERGRQSDQQKAFQRAFERAGGLYILATSPTAALQALGA